MPLSGSANDVFGRVNRKVMNAEEAARNYYRMIYDKPARAGEDTLRDAFAKAIDAATAELKTIVTLKTELVDRLELACKTYEHGIECKDKRIAELEAEVGRYMDCVQSFESQGIAMDQRSEAMAKLLDRCWHQHQPCDDPDCPRCAWEKLRSQFTGGQTSQPDGQPIPAPSIEEGQDKQND